MCIAHQPVRITLLSSAVRRVACLLGRLMTMPLKRSSLVHLVLLARWGNVSKTSALRLSPSQRCQGPIHRADLVLQSNGAELRRQRQIAGSGGVAIPDIGCSSSSQSDSGIIAWWLVSAPCCLYVLSAFRHQ